MFNPNRDAINSFTSHIFSADPVSQFLYEKAHNLKKEGADQEALKALMLAVLEEGIASYQSYFFQPSRTNEKLSKEAEEWISSEDEGIFSFNSVCESLGLDPNKMRKGLQQWKARQKELPFWKRKPLVANKGKWTGKKRKAA